MKKTWIKKEYERANQKELRLDGVILMASNIAEEVDCPREIKALTKAFRDTLNDFAWFKS